ncbi:MAG: hypothetical protein IPJ28_07765 [Betaproteobacteria bacterium]|nr:hypothetical protein [Betaproteobacteria bacterium]
MGTYRCRASGLPDTHARPDDEATGPDVKAFAAAGVDVSRIDFFPRLATAGYLSRYAEVDIALDSHPCAGATTTLDALWMGVPVVTLAGERPYGRSGASILGTLGLDDWVATTLEDYIACASAHARDPHGLETLRRDLRESLRASVLLDGVAAARALESAFERIARDRGLAGGEP